MSCKVQRIVLSFSIHVSNRLLDDLGAALSCALAVSVGIFDANSNRVPVTERKTIFARTHFSGDDRSITDVDLHSMGPEAESNAKPKCIRQPGRSFIHVGIGQDGNHGGARNRSVCQHAGFSLVDLQAASLLKIKANDAPRCGLLVTEMLPSWASIILLQMLKPSP